MMIRTRAVVVSVLVAVPVTAVLSWAVERTRRHDMELALQRVVSAQINDQVRERCESDPNWFFTGPQEGRPTGGLFVPMSPDQLEPRPRPEPQPYELFAYDENFGGSSSAAPRFPAEFRSLMRTSSQPAVASYLTERGTGVQLAASTGWTGSVCRYFLARMEPSPGQARQRLSWVLGIFGLSWLAAWATTVPLTQRIRRLAREAREAVDGGFTAIAPDTLKDELSSLTFVLNDSSQALHERHARIDDLEQMLRRFMQTTQDEVAQPLSSLESHLAAASSRQEASHDDITDALRRVHELHAHVDNLTAATRLRMLPQAPPTAPVDVTALLGRVLARHAPLAKVSHVALQASIPEHPVVIAADTFLLERAIANVVDNAVRYNRTGGSVTVSLVVDEAGRRMRLFVSDTGPGVSDDQFRGLTAIRRFRGDEARNRRPGAPGLGLAVAREVCDRFGLTLDLKRPAAGGFEAEFSAAF